MSVSDVYGEALANLVDSLDVFEAQFDGMGDIYGDLDGDLDIESCARLLGAASRLFVAAANADALENDEPLPGLGLTPTIAVVVAAALLRDQNLTPFDLTIWFQRVASEAKKSNSFNVATARMQKKFAKHLAEAGSDIS
jgi:hypothetical protein